MSNVIRLLKGSARLTKAEYEKFLPMDLIYGDGSNPEVLKIFSEEQEDEAEAALAGCKPCYDPDGTIVEYALEYCEVDDDGEFLSGSDYTPADYKAVAHVYPSNCDVFFGDDRYFGTYDGDECDGFTEEEYMDVMKAGIVDAIGYPYNLDEILYKISIYVADCCHCGGDE